jgi:4-nitrophenyl phosphatase
MRKYKLYVVDLDGVLYRGEEVIPGAVEAVSRIRERAEIRFLTNNSTLARSDFADKLLRLGFNANPAEIYTSAFGAAIIVRDSSGYVVGEDGLRAELNMGGFTEREEGAWVVAGACWHLTYKMIDEAQWLIRNGASFLATNLDATYPVEDGRVKPGAGAVIAAIATAAGKEPDIVVGKPEPTLINMIWAETGISPGDTVVIGDRLETDIECARRAGCDSALVLTGVMSKGDFKNARLMPSFVFSDSGEAV